LTADSSGLEFSVVASQDAARAGEIHLHGKTLHTPAFMPVGTLATVKSLSIEDLIHIEAECILGNTYHLHLRPGENVVAELGGVHRFMGGWPGLVLTDSGGFQVFSLAHLRSLNEDGVTFRAHTDGSTHVFTPESVVAVQEALGSDIMMVLDECPPHTLSREEASASAERTRRWAERAQQAHSGASALFGICQGGMYPELRRESALGLRSLDFPGYAIGGLGVGEEKPVMYEMLHASTGELPEDRPRYLMGIGTPDDLVNGVAAGVDMFDCVLQTREARNGALLTRNGRLNINNAQFAVDPGPIESECDCSTCRIHTRAYLHHLFRNRELLAYRLATVHNLRWTIKLMQDIRTAVIEGTFAQFRTSFLERFHPPDRSRREDRGNRGRERQ
jgi:queuine tRNA-ribosyltransferase